MADNVPVLHLSQTSNQKRYSDLRNAFVKKFDQDPSFFARASGRVNIIGEHIDYCGYAVLPMAIEQDVVIAATINSSSDKILVANTDAKYSDYECNISHFDINKSDPQWYNYFLCGLRGILEHSKPERPCGMVCMVTGSVPPSAGLSSSSALVCCSALATMYSNGLSFSKKELSDICAHCEHYIGTEGGGMDQAISFMAQQGTAKLIEFNPLRATDVLLPEGASFVVTNSCVQMNKAATSYFNIRVIECRLATQIIAKSKGLKWKEFKRLGDVQSKLGLTLEDALKLVKETFHSEPYSKEEVCGILEVTADELAQTTLSANTVDVQSFKLYDRACHVYSEANRVLQFKHVCDNKPSDALDQLGKLMNESHASCRDSYECSCPDLDRLVDICVESGALGSRLTGAGWGGCAVSMVPTSQVQDFMNKVKDKYYTNDLTEKVGTAMFATQPGGGAVLYTT